MKDRSLAGHTLVAVVAVGVAYIAWTHPSIVDKDDAVVLVPGDKDLLTGITWEDSDNRVTVTRKPSTQDDDAIEVTVTKVHPPGPPEVFPGSDAAEKLLDAMAPLMAARDLGAMDANSRAAFGLDAPGTKLALLFGTRTVPLEVGHTTFGSGDYYVRGPDNHAYLMRAATVNSLGHGAVRLQDRNVAGVRRDKFNRIVITRQARSKSFVQRHPEAAGEAFFADAAEPDRRLDAVGAFVDKLLRLRVVSIGQKTPGETPALEIALFWDKRQKAALRLWPAQDDGAVVEAPRFKEPVLVSKLAVEALLSEVDAVLGESSAGG